MSAAHHRPMADSGAGHDNHDPRVHTNLEQLIKLQYRARGFSFQPRQPLGSLLSGRHHSRLRGRGLNFEELRGYLPGDDIRNIDWKVTGRTREPHVRVYTEEKDRIVWLLIDQRQNLFFGSRNRTKSVTAAETAALAAWRVTQQGDRVGAVLFNDQTIEVVPPQRSQHGVAYLLSRCARMNGQLSVAGDGAANPGQLNRAIEKVSPLARHDTLICLITDGFGLNRDSRRLVTRLTQHNDVITALIYDPMERELPSAGLLTFTNGQGQLDVDTGNNHLRQNFAAGFDDRLEAIETLSRRYSIPVLSIDTVDDIARQIRDMIGQKHVALRR